MKDDILDIFQFFNQSRALFSKDFRWDMMTTWNMTTLPSNQIKSFDQNLRLRSTFTTFFFFWRGGPILRYLIYPVETNPQSYSPWSRHLLMFNHQRVFFFIIISSDFEIFHWEKRERESIETITFQEMSYVWSTYLSHPPPPLWWSQQKRESQFYQSSHRMKIIHRSVPDISYIHSLFNSPALILVATTWGEW